MIFCNKKTCPDNVNGQKCGKINAVLFNGICRYERDRMVRWLSTQIKECESAIRDDSSNAEYWVARKKALEEIRRWLDE